MQQNNILQQAIQGSLGPHDARTLSEQQENIGQIVTEIYRLREELAELKLTLKQGFVLIDETCSKHATVLDGLQSFAGTQVGTNQKVQDSLQCLLGQLSVVQQKAIELEKNTSLNWRMQTIEDDLTALQNMMQGGMEKSVQDKAIPQLAQQLQELRQNPLWHEMQIAATEVHEIKEKFFLL